MLPYNKGLKNINKGEQRDRERDRYLRGLGLEVLNPPLSPFFKEGGQGDCFPFFKGRFEVTHSKDGKTQNE